MKKSFLVGLIDAPFSLLYTTVISHKHNAYLCVNVTALTYSHHIAVSSKNISHFLCVCVCVCVCVLLLSKNSGRKQHIIYRMKRF